jgi:hypothetical protein
MLGLLLVVIALIVLYAVWRSFEGTQPRDWPFRRKDYLLTAAERSLFEVLCQAAGTGVYVFSKVRLADLVWLPGGIDNRRALLNRVIAKHIDFVLCERTMLRPVLAIELDDSSHAKPSRAARDEVVGRVLGAAALPLLRIRVSTQYAIEDVRARIQNARSDDGSRPARSLNAVGTSGS